GWPLAFFLLLRGDTLGAGTTGFWWMLALLFMVWANDTFAFFTGHYLGRTKLAPHVSPAKTWEGFAGGLVFTVFAAFVFTIALPTAFQQPLHVAWYHAVLLGVLVAIVGTIGDLAESLLKRGTGVKDSGRLVPGHGGILDRMDSPLFAILVVFFFALYLRDLPWLLPPLGFVMRGAQPKYWRRRVATRRLQLPHATILSGQPSPAGGLARLRACERVGLIEQALRLINQVLGLLLIQRLTAKGRGVQLGLDL